MFVGMMLRMNQKAAVDGYALRLLIPLPGRIDCLGFLNPACSKSHTPSQKRLCLVNEE
jgi:hypothetical protein